MTTFLVVCALWLPVQEPEGPDPTGALVVHVRDMGGPFHLWRLELAADGLAAEPRQLTQGSGWSYHPMVQGFGEKVVYFSQADGQTERREMKPDGSEIGPHVPDANAERDLVVSPDGRWLAYSETRDDGDNLYLRAARPADGEDAEERALTSGPAKDMAPRWSPDGRRLLFRSDRDGEGIELFVLELESGGISQVTRHDAFINDASFSPDGEHILYRSDHRGSQDLYVIPTAGGEPTQITEGPAFDGEGCWSPDGAWVAFMSDRDGNQEIYIVRPDGTGLLRITWSEDRDEAAPAWFR